MLESIGGHRHRFVERVGQIESSWAAMRDKDPQGAAIQAHMRLHLLQRALRRYLLDGQRRQLKLNRRDPVGAGVDFTELDAMVDALWGGTRAAVAPLAQSMPVRAMPVRVRSSSFAD